MEEYQLKIVGQSADLKTNPTSSKDTGIFFPPELIEFLSPFDELEFTIYKEDCINATREILMKLPLYSNKGGKIITLEDIYFVCVNYYKKIESFFGSKETALYKGSPFELTDTTQKRRYLYGLTQGDFSIRSFLS